MISALTLFGTAAAYYANSTTTVDATRYTTVTCAGPTTFTYDSQTYTVTDATTLTIKDCGCTDTIAQPKTETAPATGSVSATNSGSPNAEAVASTRVTDYVTIPCSTPTTFSYGSTTYTITEATTLTVKDCGCTDTPPSPVAPGSASAVPESTLKSTTPAAPVNPEASAVAGSTTVTAKSTAYTTIECSTPTVLAYGGSTYTVTAATTLTVEDCSCTDVPSAVPTTPAPAPAVPTSPASVAPQPSASASPVTSEAVYTPSKAATEVKPSTSAALVTPVPSHTANPTLANGAGSNAIGAAAGLAAAIAFII